MVPLFVHEGRLLWETKTENKTGFLLYGVETHRVVTGNRFLGAAAANKLFFPHTSPTAAAADSSPYRA